MELRSLIKGSGELELSLVETSIPEPAESGITALQAVLSAFDPGTFGVTAGATAQASGSRG